MKDPFANLLTTQQLADAAGCSRQTVMAYLADGKIEPAFSMPGTTGAHFWRKSQVTYLKKHIKVTP